MSCFLMYYKIISQRFPKFKNGYVMKNILVILVITFIISGSLAASNITGGFKTGINISSLYGGIDSDNSSRRGFYTGGYVNYRLNRFISLQPEFLVASKGKEDVRQYIGGHYKQSLIIYYAEFPLLGKFMILDHGSLKYNLLFGPFVSRFFGGSSNIPLDEFTLDSEEKYLLNGKINSTDYGLIFGAQMDIYVLHHENWIISFDIRHTLGLNSINASGDNDSWLVDRKNRTNSAMISLGYNFN